MTELKEKKILIPYLHGCQRINKMFNNGCFMLRVFSLINKDEAEDLWAPLTNTRLVVCWVCYPLCYVEPFIYS